ncbi:MAG: electron transfer flavoprotein subunit beta [Desulfuromonadales bacterium]|nr:electron transfer flavoprotein subunit beta [Desulfuromonadales bacterium]NIS44273.1 electron transfer flavoprotein subunit beta [Desulfuromonadales bacterium]
MVLMREACDPRPPARLTADEYGIRDRGLRRIANPADLCALEQALILAEASGGRVTAVAVGPERLANHLRLALARGAGRAVRVWNEAFEGGDVVSEARVVQRIIEILKPDILFSGDVLLDSGDDPVPALAAANLDLPYMNSAVALKREGGKVEVLRKSDRGARQRVGAAMPCAVFFQDGCAEVRYPDHDALTRALGAEIESWGIAELGLSLQKLGAAGSLLGKDKCSFPRPNPQRVVTPDAELPTFDRILALLSGGIKQREGRVHAGSPENTVEMLLNIFKAAGLIGRSER